MPKIKTTIGRGALSVTAILFVIGCGGSGNSTSAGGSSLLLPGFTQTNLVSDQPGVATLTDPNFVNGWGIAFGPTQEFWVSDNATGLTSLYSGGKVGGTITNDSPSGIQIPFGAPTGQVFNDTTDFQVTNGTTTAPALFIFASETGWIDGWNPTVNAGAAEAPGDFPGAVFKGLAIGTNATGNFLYAANFSKGTIDVFDKNYAPATLSGSFTDPGIPAGFAPFNIQRIGRDLVVTYAKQDAAKHDDVKGSGNGYISKFDTDGNFLGRLVSKGPLNSPWGVALSPGSFGQAGGLLLVGNFGDGKINVFNFVTGDFVGTLADGAKKAIVINGLWGLTFGNGGSAGDATSLYFSAGPNEEAHGLFGRINAPSVGPVKTKS